MLNLRKVAICAAALYIIIAESAVLSRDLSFPSLTGCGKQLPKGQAVSAVSNVTISSGGYERYYLISIPPTYNAFTPTPLILSYHGGVRTALDQLQLDQLTNPYFNTVSMVIYPQGINVQ
jgi:poly(3-hydroxybutyrate) depolymerase